MQTIGERLEDARKKKGISIREAAEATKIRGDYLQKFESNHFDIGLTEIYTRGFLRNYANFLKLPADRLLADFAALGHGEVRPRQPSREIYGRMDISVATAGEASDRAAPPEDTPTEAAPARAQPRYPRGGTPNLPSGPDPAVIFKYAKWAGIAVVALIALLVLKSLFSSGTPAPSTSPARATPTQAAAPATTAERTITLVALDVVRVNVKQKLPDESEGEDIFLGTLTRGQRQVVPWTGPVYIHATAGQNLEIEFQGKRYPTKFTGAGYCVMN
jgi:transcriptional regulator with XRE-family HTH domain